MHFSLPKLCFTLYLSYPLSFRPTGRQIAGFVVKRRKDFELIGTRSPQDPQVGQLAKQLLVVFYIPAEESSQFLLIRSCTLSCVIKHHFDLSSFPGLFEWAWERGYILTKILSHVSLLTSAMATSTHLFTNKNLTAR